MVLVDTSVIIDWIRGGSSHATILLKGIFANKTPHGISILTYQEVLQGAKSSKEYRELQGYLSTQTIYTLPNDLEFYNKASYYNRMLRTKGITIRSTVDLLIAMTAIWNNIPLLHDDRDFEYFASEISDLRKYR